MGETISIPDSLGVDSVFAKLLSELTIEGAEQLYTKYGKLFYSDSFYLYELFKNNGYEKGVRNDNYINALALTDLMFRKTNHSIRMLTGLGGDGFIETLIGSFKEMLQRIKKTGGQAKIIVVGSEEPKNLMTLKKEYDILKVKTEASQRKDIRHYIVADSRMLRDEILMNL